LARQLKQPEMLILLISFGLAILTEVSFFHGRIGISYPIFILAFYIVVFFRFKFAFQHRRIGLLLMVSIWILSANYLFYDIFFFHLLNILLIPMLIFIHIVLITSKEELTWGKASFIYILFQKLDHIFVYIRSFVRQGFKRMFQKNHSFVKVILGIVLAIPLIYIVLLLLMSADAQFERLVQQLPDFLFHIRISAIFRVLFIILSSLLFLGLFQAVDRQVSTKVSLPKQVNWDKITAITILSLINIVYFVFVIVQFTYLFNGRLMDGYTYAEYARQGFFELLIVLLINWTILILFLKFVKPKRKVYRAILKGLYTVLIVMSGIILFSAYIRLTMYEEAYGFTLSRVLAHVFMIYLIVIFVYTLIRVWLEKLPLLHFYIIVGIIFYTGLNAINLEQIIVDKNIERYEKTGKIDIHYLNHLSATGTLELVRLYEKQEDIEDLDEVLKHEQTYIQNESYSSSWQSYNFAREKLKKDLLRIEVRGDN